MFRAVFTGYSSRLKKLFLLFSMWGYLDVFLRWWLLKMANKWPYMVKTALIFLRMRMTPFSELDMYFWQHSTSVKISTPNSEKKSWMRSRLRFEECTVTTCMVSLLLQLSVWVKCQKFMDKCLHGCKDPLLLNWKPFLHPGKDGPYTTWPCLFFSSCFDLQDAFAKVWAFQEVTIGRDINSWSLDSAIFSKGFPLAFSQLVFSAFLVSSRKNEWNKTKPL